MSRLAIIVKIHRILFSFLLQKASMLGAFLNKAKSLLYSSVSDTFELCLARCRTSSMSVVHENAYIDEVFKYCHGANEKPLAFIVAGGEEE